MFGHVCAVACKNHKRVSDFLELESQAVSTTYHLCWNLCSIFFFSRGTSSYNSGSISTSVLVVIYFEGCGGFWQVVLSDRMVSLKEGLGELSWCLVLVPDYLMLYQKGSASTTSSCLHELLLGFPTPISSSHGNCELKQTLQLFLSEIFVTGKRKVTMESFNCVYWLPWEP